MFYTQNVRPMLLIVGYPTTYFTANVDDFLRAKIV